MAAPLTARLDVATVSITLTVPCDVVAIIDQLAASGPRRRTRAGVATGLLVAAVLSGRLPIPLSVEHGAAVSRVAG